VHFDRRLDDDIPKMKRSPDAHLRAELKDRIRAVLYAPPTPRLVTGSALWCEIGNAMHTSSARAWTR
jgi:hypothetical protein